MCQDNMSSYIVWSCSPGMDVHAVRMLCLALFQQHTGIGRVWVHLDLGTGGHCKAAVQLKPHKVGGLSLTGGPGGPTARPAAHTQVWDRAKGGGRIGWVRETSLAWHIAEQL